MGINSLRPKIYGLQPGVKSLGFGIKNLRLGLKHLSYGGILTPKMVSGIIKPLHSGWLFPFLSNFIISVGIIFSLVFLLYPLLWFKPFALIELSSEYGVLSLSLGRLIACFLVLWCVFDT